MGFKTKKDPQTPDSRQKGNSLSYKHSL